MAFILTPVKGFDKYTFDDQYGDRWLEGEAYGDDNCCNCQHEFSWGERCFDRDKDITKSYTTAYCINCIEIRDVLADYQIEAANDLYL